MALSATIERLSQGRLAADRPKRRSVALAACLFGVLLACVPASAGAAVGAGEECSNESLRQQLGSSVLADCRAYEMVSPAYKEGYGLFVLSYSADGNKAIVGGLADLAENPGEGESALEAGVYLETRTASGWQLSPMNPPLSAYVGQVFVSSEANDGESLWKQHKPNQSANTRDLLSSLGDRGVQPHRSIECSHQR